MYFCGMKERINWIDWVKAFCMTVVVFCHLPQQEDTFYLQYLASVILSSFFFVSGYLKKPSTSYQESLKKYGYSLLIPYIIYNVIYYPYWMAKFYIEHGGIGINDALKPVIGTFLLQLNSDFSCELNGVTWFLPALFLMHMVTEACNRQEHGKAMMLILTIICIVLYGANKYYHYAPYITYHGFIRCLCFFFMGNIFRQKNIFRQNNRLTDRITDINTSKELTIGLSTFAISLLLFYWHIHEEHFMLHILLYYVVNLFSVYGIIYLCRSLNSICIRLVTLISLGTMLIFGTHRILIGIIDFALEKIFCLTDITYGWYVGALITIGIMLILLPFQILALKHFPILIGKKREENLVI